MQLIENWKECWKFISVQMNTFGIFIVTLLASLPEHVISTWVLLPQEWKDVLDKQHLLYLAIIFMILSVIGRVVAQPSVEKKEIK